MPEQNDRPQRVGPYLLERPLGEGGMGRVHLARRADDPAAPPVALKVVHPHLARDHEFRTRFQREVTAASRVASRHVVPLLDADPLADPPWLATGYVPGPTLEQAVADDGPLPDDRLRALAVALASALADIHAAGLVHRDLKPSNVLLHPEHGPKVIDFGIARAVDGTRVTATGVAVGTLGFMPPEQLTEGVSEPPGDVFALGAVLAYAATGRRPFGTGSAPQVGFRTLSAEPDLDGVPEGVLPLLRACLAKDPAARPSPRRVLRMADPSAAGGRARLPEALPWRSAGRSRRRLAALAAAVAVAAAAAAGAFVVAGTGSSAGNGSGRNTGRTAAMVPPLPEPTSAIGDVPGNVRLSQAWRDYKEYQKATREEVDAATVYAQEVWLTGEVLVRVGKTAVQGIDPSTGRIRWTLTPPEPGMIPCAASAAVARNTGAVVFGKKNKNNVADCDRLVAVGLDTGTARWQQRLTEPWYRGSDNVGVSGDRVLIASEESLTAYRLADGAVAWRRDVKSGGCALDRIVAGASTFAEALTCPATERDRPTWVRSVNSADGRVRWARQVPGDIPVADLEIAEPVTVSLRSGLDPGPLLVFDDKGTPGARVSDAQGAGWKRNRFPGSPYIFGWRNTVIVVDESSAGQNDPADSVSAIDTRSGRIRWRQRFPGGLPLVAGVDDRGVLVVQLSDTPERLPALTRLSLDRGVASPAGSLNGPALRSDEFQAVRMTGRHLALFTDQHSLLNGGLVMYAAKTS